LFYWEGIQVWCWLVSLLLDRRRKSIEMWCAYLRHCEWNLLGLNILKSLGGLVLKESVLCEKECHCVDRNFEDPRNECVTTGSFPACVVMWVSYICDLLGYSQHLGNLWSTTLIYTLHQWKSNIDNCTVSLCVRGSLYQQCLCHLLSRPFCLTHSLHLSIQDESL
jgi:hypothetical protein